MKAVMKQQVRQDTVTSYWRISLAAGLVVIAAVALLLTILARTAEQIQSGTAQIWQVGKLIANNTVHIPLLVRTNQIVTEIDQAANGIVRATERIQRTVAGSSQK